MSLVLFRLLFLSCFCLIVGWGFGQSDLDSLKSLLDSSGDSLKVEIYIELSKAHNHFDPHGGLRYAMQAGNIARELDDIVMLGKSINSEGVSYYWLNELELSDDSYQEALQIFDSVNYLPGMARTLNNIGWNYKVKNQPDEAITFFEQGLEIARNIEDFELVQGILNNLGTIYRTKQEYEKALRIYQESFELNKKSGNVRWQAYNLNNIGMVYMDMGKYDLSMTYLNRAKTLNVENEYIQEYCKNLLNMGMVKVLVDQYDSAEYFLRLAGDEIEQHGFKRIKLEFFDYHVKLNERRNDFEKALEFHRQFFELNEELNHLAWNEKLSELAAKYNLAQKERELDVSERKLNQQKFVILVGSSIFILLLTSLVLVIRLYKEKNNWAKNVQKLNNAINQKNEELNSMNLEVQKVNNNLEELVKERTDEITNQNEKLMKYAFINSHEVRGPLARVLGLLYLINLEDESILDKKAFRLLNEATYELDNVVKQTSKLLEDESFYSKKPPRSE